MGQLNSSIGGEAGRATVLLGGGVGISPGALKVRAGLPPSLLLFLGFFNDEPARAVSAGASPVPATPLFSLSLFLKVVNMPTAWSISLLAITETKNVLVNRKK